MGVSLWLVPGPAHIDVIKSSFPGRPSIGPGRCTRSPSSYPAILPHITLATVPFSDPEIPNMLLDAVPEDQVPLCIYFQSLAVGDHYFRSVFIDILRTQELVGLQNQIFTNLRRHGLEPSAPRFPHMSLCYIADEDKSDRDKTAQALRDTGAIRPTADMQYIALQCGDVGLIGFDGVEIWLVHCEGPVETWEVDERKVKLTPKS